VTEFEIRVSEDIEGGVYSNVVSVWHTGHEFTLDFCSSLQNPSGEAVPLRVVARVKLPVSVIFDLLKAINSNMTKYEAVFGDVPTVQPLVEGGQDGGQPASDDD
jgi:hypothetical protein